MAVSPRISSSSGFKTGKLDCTCAISSSMLSSAVPGSCVWDSMSEELTHLACKSSASGKQGKGTAVHSAGEGENWDSDDELGIFGLYATNTGSQ